MNRNLVKGLIFFKGCAIAVFGFVVIRLRDPIVEDKPFNTSIVGVICIFCFIISFIK